MIELAGGIAPDGHEAGPRDAPALIFPHGFPESWRTWRHQITHLSHHFRCIAPDQRGYGASSRPLDVGAYAPEALVGDVFALADALGIGRFTLIGHDWGGVVAWMAADLAAHGLAPTLLRLFGKGALAAMESEERAHLLARWQDGDMARAMVNWYRASPIVVGNAPVTMPAPLPMPVQVIWGMADRDLLPACLDGLDAFLPIVS